FTPVNRPAADPVLNTLDDQLLQIQEQQPQRRLLLSKREAGQLTPPPTTAKKPRRERLTQPKKIETTGENASHHVSCNFSASDSTEAAQRYRTKLQLAPAGATVDSLSQSGLENVGLSGTTIARLASFRYQGEPQTELPKSCFWPDSSQASERDYEPASRHHDAEQGILSYDTLVRRCNPCLVDTCENDVTKETPSNELGDPDQTVSFDSIFEEVLEDYANTGSDDEFPIDEQDAQCLLQLPTVEEGFEPPLSVQIPFDDNSQTNGIYDPHLQHSRPPSSRSLRAIQVDGVTISVGNRTTIDDYRFSRSRLFQFLGRSFPCPNGDNDNEAYSDVNREDKNLLDDVDSDFIDLGTAYPERVDELPSALPKPALDAELPKLQWNPSTMYKPTKTLPTSEIALFSSPVAESQRLPPDKIPAQSKPPPPAPHLINIDSVGNALPFARPPFPSLVLDRSPILGVSSSSFLRSCFRIGEALNVATQASYTGAHPLIELYARVTYSHRVGVEQFIQFADLFRSEKPPFLNGSFVGWKGVDLWDNDSKAFLGDTGKGKIARCIGNMKRDETRRGWKMMVLSIWEADWDDVAYVKGIVCS
ncbi:hypothetical protein MMC27_000246, partial [Xylographa pallens]|nr:hypothetical protein [Xylographa pallens]